LVWWCIFQLVYTPGLEPGTMASMGKFRLFYRLN